MRKMAGKASWGLLAVIVLLGMFFAWQLASQSSPAQLREIELTDVIHDECFSPNNDGGKDNMDFTALFSGPAGNPVFAALFIRKDGQWINFRIGAAVFSATGAAEIQMPWNGKDVSGQTVTDGDFSLLLYYFNIPGLYNQLANQKIDKVMAKIEQRLMQREKQDMLKRWDGGVTVDVLPPELTVSVPEAGLRTYETAVLTSGTVFGADTLKVNAFPLAIDNGQFSGTLELASGMNTFIYVAEDCAGNRDQETRTLERLLDADPPVITIASPAAGSLLNGLPVLVSASFHDEGCGIDPASLKALLNGADITSLLNINDGAAIGEVNDDSLLNDGANLLRVEAVDRVGNACMGMSSFNFEKVADKDKTFVYGRVLDISGDAPLAGATISASGKETLSNDQGQWKLYFSEGGTFKIKITKAGYSEVYRKAQVAKGEEAVVDDAYLTLLDTKTTVIGPEGGTHSNSGETVEIVIPAGALSEAENIQVTRLSASRALPGGLNETANLQYPISFLFCADLQPNGTTFAQAVKLRVKNTWGFAAGTQIPFAFWDKDNQTWLPEGMATVNADHSYLEAEISHFSFCDINTADTVARTAGHNETMVEPVPPCEECMASSVDINTGSLRTDLSIPGVKVRGGDTGISLVYNSSTAYPTSILRVLNLQDDSLVLRPESTSFKVASSLLGHSGSNGFAALGTFHFNPPGGYGAGALIFNGVYPSGRVVRTGYQDIDLTFTNYYPGEFAFVANWGGVPTGSTGVVALEPAYLEDKREKKVFMVSRADSPFGRGWQLAGLKKLHFEGNRAVVVAGDGSFREYEQGINFADKTGGATVLSSNYPMHDAEKMLLKAALRPVRQEGCARFYFSGVPAVGSNQTFTIDLGQERSIYTIGMEFPQYWTRLNVWDFIRISTSLDNVEYSPWSQWGQPTLNNPAAIADPLDNKIKSPYLASRADRAVRYIKYELGFPSVNTVVSGSGIYRVYAIGDENKFRSLDEEIWPKLSLDTDSGNYILEEYSGSQTVFDADGLMIAEKERSGRTIAYEYNDERLIRINYPESVYMEFSYGSGGRLEKVKDSSGRETMVNMDESGDLMEVVYADGEKRQLSYNDRGLLLTDKNGNAEKAYTWDANYAVLTEVELPNGGKRTLNPWVLNFALNGRQSTPGQPIDFPASGDAMESTVTFEDGQVEKRVTGSGWSWKYMNGKLQEKTMYGDLKNNRLPVEIARGDTGWDNTIITYNNDQQASFINGTLRDNQWVPEDVNNHAPYHPGTSEYNLSTKYTAIVYNTQRLVDYVNSYDMKKTFFYDAKGNLLKVEELSSHGKTTQYAYNDDGDLIKVTYPDGKMNEMVYDSLGLVREVKNNDGTKTTLERDSRGDVTAMVDEMDRRVELTRDVMGRVIKEKSPGEKEVNYQWGGEGCSSCGDGSKLSKIIDAAGNAWDFAYDVMGNPIEMTYPGGSKISQEYDIAGRLSKFINKRGQEITYDYDVFGKLTKKTTPEGEIDFTYDNRDRITEIQGNDFHYRYSYGNFITGWSYVWCSTIVQEENVNSGNWIQTFTNYYGLPYQTFDNFGWRKLFNYNFGGSAPSTPVGPTPQSIHYYKRYSSSSSLMYVQYVYDNNLRIAAKNTNRFHNEHFYTPDANGLLKEIYYRADVGHPGSFPTGRLSFTRDQSGLIQTMTNDLAMTVNYDPDLQISSINHTLPQPFDESYSYDANGNRVTSLANTFIYDDLNKLTESTTHEYTYDADGNMTHERNKLTGETKRYYWDSESRMIKYEHLASDLSPVDTTALYKYDIYGRRIQKEVNGAIINFMWEGDNVSLELDATNQPIRKYFTEIGMDDYFAHLNYAEVTNWSQVFSDWYPQGWYGYIKDQVGTIYKVWDHNTRTIADSRTYDSFGNLVNQLGTTKTQLGFQGKYYDQESGLNYFYHRYYNPTLGRFISEDPIGLGGGINYYKFVSNNPLQRLDPTGLDWTDNYKEQYRKISEDAQTLSLELKRILRENQTDINESRKYCPKWGECFQECFHTVINSQIEVAMQAVDWFVFKIPGWVLMNKGIWVKAGSTMIMTGEMIMFGGAISNLGAAAYCAAQCALNPKSF